MHVPSEQTYGLLEGQRTLGTHVAPYSTHSPEGHRNGACGGQGGSSGQSLSEGMQNFPGQRIGAEEGQTKRGGQRERFETHPPFGQAYYDETRERKKRNLQDREEKKDIEEAIRDRYCLDT